MSLKHDLKVVATSVAQTDGGRRRRNGRILAHRWPDERVRHHCRMLQGKATNDTEAGRLRPAIDGGHGVSELTLRLETDRTKYAVSRRRFRV